MKDSKTQLRERNARRQNDVTKVLKLESGTSALVAVAMLTCVVACDSGVNESASSGAGGAASSVGSNGATSGVGGSEVTSGVGGSGGESNTGGTGGMAGMTSCEDVVCDSNASCDDSSGTAVCTCNDGFAGDGSQCNDIDECADMTANCNAPAICTNNDGGFSCDCPQGYTDTNGDGSQCNDIDECASMLANCDPQAACSNEPGGFMCTCPATLADVNGDGSTCHPHISCLGLSKAGVTVNGIYTIDPDGVGGDAPFNAYCDMSEDGGGWTLVFNSGLDFVRSERGSTTDDCYMGSCINRAYSTVPIVEDIMLDQANTSISGASWNVRTRVNGVQPALVGQTVHTLMNTSGDWHLERENNSDVTNTFQGGLSCNSSLWPDYLPVICSTPVITFFDTPSGCGGTSFAIGADHSHTSQWGNCAGWPEAPHHYYPHHYRVWVR